MEKKGGKTLLADCLFIDWISPINRHLINSDATVAITLQVSVKHHSVVAIEYIVN